MSDPRANELFGRFANAVIRDRPATYAGMVTADFARFFTPGVASKGHSDVALFVAAGIVRRRPGGRHREAFLLCGMGVVLLAASAATLWRQPDLGAVEGIASPYLLLTVRADSSGTAGEFSGHGSEAAARAAATRWLGADREVPVDLVPHSALNWLFTAVTGSSLR